MESGASPSPCALALHMSVTAVRVADEKTVAQARGMALKAQREVKCKKKPSKRLKFKFCWKKFEKIRKNS